MKAFDVRTDVKLIIHIIKYLKQFTFIFSVRPAHPERCDISSSFPEPFQVLHSFAIII